MGVIFPDCEAGYKHASDLSEVIIRDSITLEVLPHNQEGLIQFLSPVPHSYPGISVLTDDIGFIAEDQTCTCGREGTKFKIIGRAKKAEVRGCGEIMGDKLVAATNISEIKQSDSQQT